MTAKHAGLAVAAVLIVSRFAHPAAPEEEADRGARFSVTVDARSWATLVLGVEAPLGGSGLSAVARVGAPLFVIGRGDADSWETSAGIASRLPLGAAEDFSLDWEAALTLGANEQVLGSFLQFGSRLSLRPAWNRSFFSAGAALVWDQGWITRYRASSVVEATFEDRYGGDPSGAASGWFLWGDSTILFGPDLRAATDAFGSWRCAGGLRANPGSLVGLGEGFPIGEWPFWFELGWAYP